MYTYDINKYTNKYNFMEGGGKLGKTTMGGSGGWLIVIGPLSTYTKDQ